MSGRVAGVSFESLSAARIEFDEVLSTYERVQARLMRLGVELPTTAQLVVRVPQLPGALGQLLTAQFRNALSAAARWRGGEVVQAAVGQWVALVERAVGVHGDGFTGKLAPELFDEAQALVSDVESLSVLALSQAPIAAPADPIVMAAVQPPGPGQGPPGVVAMGVAGTRPADPPGAITSAAVNRRRIRGWRWVCGRWWGCCRASTAARSVRTVCGCWLCRLVLITPGRRTGVGSVGVRARVRGYGRPALGGGWLERLRALMALAIGVFDRVPDSLDELTDIRRVRDLVGRVVPGEDGQVSVEGFCIGGSGCAGVLTPDSGSGRRPVKAAGPGCRVRSVGRGQDGKRVSGPVTYLGLCGFYGSAAEGPRREDASGQAKLLRNGVIWISDPAVSAVDAGLVAARAEVAQRCRPIRPGEAAHVCQRGELGRG